jgi:hypothetical protein
VWVSRPAVLRPVRAFEGATRIRTWCRHCQRGSTDGCRAPNAVGPVLVDQDRFGDAVEGVFRGLVWISVAEEVRNVRRLFRSTENAEAGCLCQNADDDEGRPQS